MNRSFIMTALLGALVSWSASGVVDAQETLPFPKAPTASTAGKTLAESTHHWRQRASHLRKDAPNVLIIMLDDAGYAQADTVGGPIHTPTLSRIADSGVRYNDFNTTAICSSTRASLLTGRNQHRVGSGTITELASDFDGYTGTIPRSSATVAEVLKDYGYSTVAFGKWHNTPPNETGPTGPFNHWPIAYGFEHFYGFLGGETSQYEPRLFNDYTPVEPSRDPRYHLTEDLATHAVNWLQRQHSEAPDTPFFMYWAPGAVHGPHQIFKAWSDKYKGKFDAGWDVYRQQTFARQKALGWVPKDAKLTPRPDTLPAWDSLSPEEKKFQARLMEVYAGFLEHTDTQAGRVIDELERLGIRDNTLVLYLFSDNGASAEGLTGTINELLTQNGIPVTTAQQMQVLQKQYGGLDALGGPRLESMYHAAWAWAGMTPFRGTKLVAGYFGGTRAPLAISWPQQIKADAQARAQFHHVNDIVPTIYDVVGITPPKQVNGVTQDPFDGVSMRYTFANANAPSIKPPQYFEVLGSRGIYADGWIASVFGPRIPWKPGPLAALRDWNPENDIWSLYHVDKDFSEADDLAAAKPAKLAEMKSLFDRAARDNHVYPIGAGLIPLLYPDQRIGTTATEWTFTDLTRRLPEFAAPDLRARHSRAVVDLTVPAQANGVVYALGGRSGGVTLYFDHGKLTYEYNGLVVATTTLHSDQPLAAGTHRIEVETLPSSARPGAPAKLILSIDGKQADEATTPFTVPLTFTATESFDVGCDLGSSVSLAYFDRAPFDFDGHIERVHIEYMP